MLLEIAIRNNIGVTVTDERFEIVCIVADARVWSMTPRRRTQVRIKRVNLNRRRGRMTGCIVNRELKQFLPSHCRRRRRVETLIML